MKAPLVKHDSAYISSMMKDVKKMPADVIEMYSKFYREFQESDFDLDTDKKLFDWSAKQTYIALGNMMTSAALVGIDSCPIEGFHQEKQRLYYERSSTWIQRNTFVLHGRIWIQKSRSSKPLKEEKK
jgi:hypothetical protein